MLTENELPGTPPPFASWSVYTTRFEWWEVANGQARYDFVLLSRNTQMSPNLTN